MRLFVCINIINHNNHKSSYMQTIATTTKQTNSKCIVNFAFIPFKNNYLLYIFCKQFVYVHN